MRPVYALSWRPTRAPCGLCGPCRTPLASSVPQLTGVPSRKLQVQSIAQDLALTSNQAQCVRPMLCMTGSDGLVYVDCASMPAGEGLAEVQTWPIRAAFRGLTDEWQHNAQVIASLMGDRRQPANAQQLHSLVSAHLLAARCFAGMQPLVRCVRSVQEGIQRHGMQ